jgi:hypothetical protein
MSYCVNCGVQLAQKEKKCPLCGVEVINPRETADGDDFDAFPKQRDTVDAAFDKDMWIKLVSIILAVPAIICFVSNMLVHSEVFWSMYVVGAAAVLWTFCVSPLLFKRYFPLLWIVANTVASLGYLFLIELLSATKGWFMPLALPIVLGVAVLSLVILVLMQREVLKDFNAAAGIVFAAGVLTVLVELSISLYTTGALHMGWSWFSFISCAAMAAVLVIIERKLRVKEKLKRRLHF